MSPDLASLGLIPQPPAPDAILLAQIERWHDLRAFILDISDGITDKRIQAGEYFSLEKQVVDTPAVTSAGRAAKLRAALASLSCQGGKRPRRNLSIAAIEDVLRAVETGGQV